jgi:hypothetical protein
MWEKTVAEPNSPPGADSESSATRKHPETGFEEIRLRGQRRITSRFLESDLWIEMVSE